MIGTVSPILRARCLCLVRLGPATAIVDERTGHPSTRYATIERERGTIFAAPNAGEAARLLASGGAALFEAPIGSKLAELLPAVLDLPTPAEAADAGAGIRHAAVWLARRGPDGFWHTAPGQTGSGPATDAVFPDAKTIRQHWAKHPKSTPLFVLREREGVWAFAWIKGALVEALRH